MSRIDPLTEHLVDSYDQVLQKARSVFPDCTLRAEDGQWIIETNLREDRSVDPSWEGTAAHEAYLEHEGSYGSVLERWAHKNGFSGASLHEAAQEYNKMIADQERRSKELLERLIGMGREDVLKVFTSKKALPITDEQSCVYEQVINSIQ